MANQHGEDGSDEEQQRVIESPQVTPVQDQQMGVSIDNRRLKPQNSVKIIRRGRRVSSILLCQRLQGCYSMWKTFTLSSYYRMLIIEILASYEYKMCPTCCTRYRTYGNTKRAKWKAERDAFDREMAILRAV